MRPSARGKSNTNKKIQPSQVLEKEAKDMEEKLKMLKRQMAGEKERREDIMNKSGSRWATASQAKPLKNYSKKCIDQKNEYIQKTGGKLGGTGTFAPQQQNGQKRNSLNKTMQPSVLKTSRPSSSSNLNQAPLKKNGGNKENRGILPPSSQNNFVAEEKQPIQPQQQSSQLNIENNLQKHLQLQKGKEKDHKSFLEELKLSQYIDKFEENGFDDIETIIELNTELLNDMLIPAGHQIKIMKKVDKIRQEKNLDPQKEHILNQYRPPQKKRTDLVELEYQEPVVQQHSIAIGDDAQQVKAQKKSEFDGEYNEKDSHNSFLEALYEWRGQKAPQQTQVQTIDEETEYVNAADDPVRDNRKKSVKFGNDVVDNEGKSTYRKPGGKQYTGGQQQKEEKKQSGGLFFMQGGSKEYDNSKYTSNSNSDTQTNKEIPVGEKIGCWNCYKLFPIKQEIKYTGKSFCGQKCYDHYVESQTMVCSGESCQERRVKGECIFKNGMWYCSEKCAPSLEELVVQMRNSQVRNEQNEQKKQEEIQQKQQQQTQEFQPLDEQAILELESTIVNRKNRNKQEINADNPLELENKILSLEELERKCRLENSQILENKSRLNNNSNINNNNNQKSAFDNEDDDILADSLDTR